MLSLPTNSNSLTLLAVVLLASTLSVGVFAQQDGGTGTISCTDTELADCLTLNRDCIQNECTSYCLEGFISVPVPDSDAGEEVCVEIASLTVQNVVEYLQSFNASFRQTREAPVTPRQRLEILRDVAMFISEHNNNRTGDELDFELGLTAFSFDTPEDEKDRAGFVYDENPDPRYFPRTVSVFDGVEEVFDGLEGLEPLPSEVDWTKKGGVTFVKDQGRCGCCWATAVCGAIEGAAAAHAIENGYEYLQSLSWQQLISCDDRVNGGCNGGDIRLATGYAELNLFGGMATNNDYPFSDYDGDTTDTCKLDEEKTPVAVEVPIGIKILDFDDPYTFEERVQIFKRTLVKQPIAMVIKSSCKTLSNYKKGVLTDDGGCSVNTYLDFDHAVLMVGYNDDADKPYFKIKNSWGEGWGEDGYFRVSQKQANGRFGLFGVMGHGVVPEVAFNVTGQVKDEKQDVPLQPYEIALIVLFSVIGVLVLMLVAKKFMAYRKAKQEEEGAGSE